MSKPRIAILGAGPAGLGAAWQLAKQGKADVTVLEQREAVGGNAGSFELAGIHVDYGSHRLHPACKPEILEDLRNLLGPDLLDRPRHGRIRLRDKWIHFPLKPQDLALRLPLDFSSGVAFDLIGKYVPQRKALRNGNGHATFASVLEKGLGPTICRDFYFPYARKIWGAEPSTLSAIQAKRRVSAGSLGKMARKILTSVPGFKKPGAGRFFYPRRGFGQISSSIADAAVSCGVDLRLGSPVKKLELGRDGHRVIFESDCREEAVTADYIWSTLPVTVLAKIASPSAPEEVIAAANQISYRAMVLIYLVLDKDQWTEFDAHYFPDEGVKLTRLSEPKNYSAGAGADGRTVLCGELPCNVGDDVWNATDQELAEIAEYALGSCGLPLNAKVLEVVTKRLPYAYPIYTEGYETFFDIQDKWAESLDRVLTFGRQGLFAHDNTHHALAMAYAAADCLRSSGDFDSEKWQEYRKEFETHVVED